MADQESMFARELAALEDRQQAMTEKEITGEKEGVDGPSPTYDGGKKFCPLCKRFVSPTGGNADAAVVLGTTAIFGIVITWLHNSSVSTGTYNYNTGTTTLTFTEAYLSALLSFALDIFIILLIASIVYGLYVMGREKRCPLCNAHFS